MIKVQVAVRLKADVLDPQGDAVRRALTSLGLTAAKKVRVGKLIELDIDAADSAAAKAKAQDMGRRLLANPVIEDFEVSVVD
ncbi:MAG: phosphoribosylformylglycinamidine synthase subunit PurS [Polyangiales bacterium]